MRRHLAPVFAVLILAAATQGEALAGSEQRKGTSGATELRIGVGPRGNALGSSVVGDIAGIEALFFNPAGLASMENTEATFSHTQYFADMKLNYAAVGTVTGFGAIALSAKVLSIGEVIVTTEDAPDGTGEIAEPTFSVLGLHYARQFTDRVLFGGSISYVNERIISTTANGVAFDFGVQYLTGWNGLRFGMSMKNFGPSMKFDGDDLNNTFVPPDSDPQSGTRTFRATSAAFEMPSYFVLGASYDLINNGQNRFALMSAFQNNNFIGDNLSGGAEWTYRQMFSLRGSYFGSILTNTDPVTGADSGVEFESGDDLYQGFAIGAGARIQTGGSKLGVDVAFKPVDAFFDDVVEVALKLSF